MMETIQALVENSRTRRRFYEERPVELHTLEALADLGRLSPCGANKQALRYILCCEREQNARIFGTLRWAAALTDWDGPVPGEQPAAYIILAHERALGAAPSLDDGIAAQSIFLGMTERGLGGCMLLNYDRDALSKLLGLDTQRYALSLVIALGVPKEEVVIEPVGPDGSTAYYRDDAGRHHVPKRALCDVIIQAWPAR